MNMDKNKEICNKDKNKIKNENNNNVSLAERSKAAALGAVPKGRGFESLS